MAGNESETGSEAGTRARLLLVGHGKMGVLVERLAPEYGFAVGAVVTRGEQLAALPMAPAFDVAVDFSVPHAVAPNLAELARRGTSAVIGTTGWHEHEETLRALAAGSGIGVLAAPNFALGVSVFQLLVEEAGRRFARHPGYGAWIHELHHAAKRDAPSGTARALERALRDAGYDRGIDVASSRAGSQPGLHTVGFDGPSDTITLSHQVRDRAVFARGALEAARWLIGRRGWFTLRQMIEIREP